MNRKPRLRDEGFALLELLVSVAILGAVLGGVYVLYFQGRQMIDALSGQDRNIRSTSVFLERVQADLNGFAGLVTDSAPPELGESKKETEEEEGAFIRMLSILQRGDAPSRPQLVIYFLRKDPDQKTGVIVRRERDPSAEDDAAAKEVLILKGVSDVKVETYTSSWNEGWPTGGNPSKLFRLTLVSERKGKHIESAAFTFELPQKGRATTASTTSGGADAQDSTSGENESGGAVGSSGHSGQEGSASPSSSMAN
jgi:prepilin-type N-terminal cleavage/methylation domain-containing protein